MKLDGIHICSLGDSYVKSVYNTRLTYFNRDKKGIIKDIKNGNVYTYNIDGIPVGTFTIKKFHDYYLLMDIFISKGYRCVGIGSKIVNHFIGRYNNNKMVTGCSIKYIHWFSKFGFRVKDMIGNVILMEK